METNRNQRYHPRHPQNGRNGNNNAVRNGGGGAAKNNAKSSNGAKRKRTEANKPIRSEALENLMKTENDAEFITTLSSEKNGFLLLLDEQSIRPDVMCSILAALAKASRSSTEQNTVQLLVHFYMEIIPKLCDQSNFHRELKLYITDLSKNVKQQKHNAAIEDLLTFLRRLQLTIYQRSFDAVRDFMHLISVQIEFLNRKENLVNEFTVDLMNQLNESVENVDQMKQKTERTEVLMEPPQDFREISIYPDTYDILSNHEPFIRANVVNGKYAGGIDHYLDVQFRLLREDFVRPLRNGISEYCEIKSNPELMAATKFRINDLNIYQNVHIHGSEMLHNEQVHFCLFDIKPFRHLQWQYNKRMINGSLVCLSSDDFETFFFATVAGDRDPTKLARGQFQIKLEMESSAMTEITPLITYVMAESQVYFEAYRHNLKVLQDFGIDNFPLEKYIVNVDKTILPPAYLTNNPTYLISNGLPAEDPEARELTVNVLGDQQWPPREDFRLDESQYDAFRAALTKQMVVIQGPPGTGKTYIGLRIVEVLLANTSQWPILIVCYTNHALDQFLEGILKFVKADDLVRIGGKSQCEELQDCNLAKIKSNMKLRREVPEFIHKARMESKEKLNRIQGRISCLENNIKNINDSVLGLELREIINKLNPNHYTQLSRLSEGGVFNKRTILNWLGYVARTQNNNYRENDENNGDGSVFNVVPNQPAETEMEMEMEMDEEEVKELAERRFIDENSDDDDNYHLEAIPQQQPVKAEDIIPMDFEDDEGFELVIDRTKMKQTIQHEITKTETMTEEQAIAVPNINFLQPNDRWNLYRLWLKLYVQEFKTKINTSREQYRTECLRFNGLRKQEDIEIVKEAKIIGMTTTGAAKYRHIIDGTKPKITIVEEAAEVLEAHIVTALCKQTDHLILIGDHLQLRPNPAVYELAKKFNLEVSLFERLINNEMDYYQLKQQHRMRPCISALLVPHIYKQLLDHPSVRQYEDVKGISKNMFFLNHGKNEMTMQETRSHLNVHEAEFIVELCRYIILQGYETSQVTILTTYSGQLQRIRKLMRDPRNESLLSGVRATVVDNYQGEECDIILLSFVRSNEEGNIGFLKDSHRVNVALSRAKKGLYCIGNFDCLAEKSQLWQNLMNDLKAQGAIGEALEIYCQNHTDHKTLLKSKDDFRAAPDGGCELACDSRLPCGHSCTKMCHIKDLEHIGLFKFCPKKCNKECERGHSCPKHCHHGEECKCSVMVQKLRSKCQHYVQARCSDNSSLAEVKCSEKVQVPSPCGHTVTVNCTDPKDNLILLNECTEPCRVELKCGHLCKGSCSQCKVGRLHISCTEKCTKILICGHPCEGTCSVDCAPCKANCANRCAHKKCFKRCGDPCSPCMKKCAWRCEHLECSKLCSEPCDRELCEHADTKLIKKCGHQSIGVCGEKLPQLCRICNKDEVKEILGQDDEGIARFIELEDCKHVMEVNGLIQWMKTEPESSGIDSMNNIQNGIQFKQCQKCQTIIRRTKSLNTFIQATLRDVDEVKLMASGNPKANGKIQCQLIRCIEGILKKQSNHDLVLVRTVCRIILNDLTEDLNSEPKLKPKSKPEPKPKPKSKRILIEQSNKFELTNRLIEIHSIYNKRQKKNQQVLGDETIAQFDRRLRMATLFVKDFKNCDQQRADISAEIPFLQMMAEIIAKVSNQRFKDMGEKLLNQAFDLANKYGSVTDRVRSEFENLVHEAFKHPSFGFMTKRSIFLTKVQNGSDIPLNEAEVALQYKEIILKTVSFARDYWYKCSKGHVYAIGDFEGAKCPECKLSIGNESLEIRPKK